MLQRPIECCLNTTAPYDPYCRCICAVLSQCQVECSDPAAIIINDQALSMEAAEGIAGLAVSHCLQRCASSDHAAPGPQSAANADEAGAQPSCSTRLEPAEASTAAESTAAANANAGAVASAPGHRSQRKPAKAASRETQLAAAAPGTSVAASTLPPPAQEDAAAATPAGGAAAAAAGKARMTISAADVLAAYQVLPKLFAMSYGW